MKLDVLSSTVPAIMTDAKLIDSIGRSVVVAELKPEYPDLTLDAVNKWVQRSIPWKYRQAVKRLAKRRRKRVPADFLEVRSAA